MADTSGLFLLLYGGGVSLASSLITSIAGHFLSRSRDKGLEAAAEKREDRAEGRAVGREQRARDDEATRWARELRRQAHLEFQRELYKLYMDVDGEDLAMHRYPPEDYLRPLEARYEELRLVAENQTLVQADETISDLRKYCFEGGPWQNVEWSRDNYLAEVRKELHLPPVKLMLDDAVEVAAPTTTETSHRGP